MMEAVKFSPRASGAPRRLERIATGSRVRLRELSDDSDWEVTIVPSEMADPETDLISDVCPIGQALLGRRAGEVVRIEVPIGIVRYRVVSVSRPLCSGLNAAGLTADGPTPAP